MYIYKLCTERSFRCLRRQRQRAEKPAFDAADDDDGNEVVVVAALKFFEFFVFFLSLPQFRSAAFSSLLLQYLAALFGSIIHRPHSQEEEEEG